MNNAPVTRPGIYIADSLPHSSSSSLAAAPTSVTAFVGRTAGGPADRAVRLRGFGEFTSTFGGAHPESELADSVRLFFENGGTECYVVRIDKDVPTSVNYLGDRRARTGMHALDKVGPVGLMVIPPDRDLNPYAIYPPASHYCLRQDTFLLIDPPADWTRSGRAEAAYNQYVLENLRRGMTTQNSAVFYPRIKILEDGALRAAGPCGAIAGLLARRDAEKGVWAMPAGSGAELRSVHGPEVELGEKDLEVSKMSAFGVNCLVKRNGRLLLWGAKTFHGIFEYTGEWRYFPVARTALFLEASISRGTAWTAFERNDEVLWAKIRVQVTEFMLRLWRYHAFVGDTPSDSVYVRCGRETMTDQDRAKGRVIIEVGFAATRPAEFVVITVEGQAVPAAPAAPAAVRPTLDMGTRSSGDRTTSRSTPLNP